MSHPDTWAHIRVPHICSACVRVRIHTHTLTYTPSRVEKKKTQITLLSSFLSKITPHFKQQVPSYTSWIPSSTFPNAKWTNIHERICTSCSERVCKCVRWCTQHLFNVNACACRTHVWMHTTLHAKNAYAPVHARPCNSAESSFLWNLLRTYLDSCEFIL